jgi:FtsZ-interacting cell division protein ZipA
VPGAIFTASLIIRRQQQTIRPASHIGAADQEKGMDQNQLYVVIVVAIIAVVIIAAVAFVTSRKRRSEKLRQKFGPEYDRVVKQEGNPRKAEGVLEFRTKRRERFQLRPLPAADKSSYTVRWNEVQARFVDDPRGAVTVADGLVTEVMQARGYPIGDFEQRAADLSVDYPIVVDNYRAAHQIALRHGAGQASTEDLRQAMVHYRALFQELLDERQIENQIEKKGA